MTTVIVLNGASSSGKSSIARALQALLAEPYLTFGTDTLVDALPAAMADDETGISVAADGTVSVGPGFRRLEHAWFAGLTAIARDAVGIIIDEVLLEGGEGQRRVRERLSGLDILWVGVHCDVDVATAREALRPDRSVGMARSQALIVHDGVEYDIEVDTTHATAVECAAVIAAVVGKVSDPARRERS
jgi:chloramphenicol 3-O phosphotransferase